MAICLINYANIAYKNVGSLAKSGEDLTFINYRAFNLCKKNQNNCNNFSETATFWTTYNNSSKV